MAEAEAAWLAGFFDGEGSLVAYSSPRSKYGKAWSLSVPNTNQDAVTRCQQITGAGSVLPRKGTAPAHYKPQWIWSVHSQRNIASILKQILPYLVIKKQASTDFLNEWSDIQE